MERTDDGGADIAFDLKFTKARERTPENRNDFEPVRITPAGDRWASTGAEPRPAGKPKEPSPLGQKFFDALLKMISEDGAPVRSERVDTGGRPAVSFDQWQAECKWRGLVDKEGPGNRRRAMMSKYRAELIACNWIKCEEDVVWSIRRE